MKRLKKIGITGHFANEMAKEYALQTIKLLKKAGIMVQTDRDFSLVKKALEFEEIDSELILVFGGDGTMLHVARKLQKDIPIMGINCGEKGHMIDLNFSEFKKNLDSILKGEFELEERTRLKVGETTTIPYALNEVVLFPKKGGMLIDYDLEINGELAWRDAGDGVIVATATGSTGHALSAGGPVIYNNANVLAVVPIASRDKSRKALIVEENSVIRLSKFDETHECEIILDGQVRFPVMNEIMIKKGKPVFFARKRIEKKEVELKEVKLSPAAKLILKILETEGNQTQTGLMKESGLPERTIRRNLKELMKKNLIRIEAFKEGARKKIYAITR